MKGIFKFLHSNEPINGVWSGLGSSLKKFEENNKTAAGFLTVAKKASDPENAVGWKQAFNETFYDTAKEVIGKDGKAATEYADFNYLKFGASAATAGFAGIGTAKAVHGAFTDSNGRLDVPGIPLI